MTATLELFRKFIRFGTLSCRCCRDFTAMEVRFSKWFQVNIITINCSIHTRSDQNAVLFMTLVFLFQLKFISSTYFISQVVQFFKRSGTLHRFYPSELKFHTPSSKFLLLKKLDIALVPFSFKFSAANLPI